MFGSLKGDSGDDILPKKLRKMKEVSDDLPNKEFYQKHMSLNPRYKLSIITDKDTYKPGETVYVRGTILDAFNHTPCGKERSGLGNLKAKIVNSKDEEIIGGRCESENGIISFEWVTSEDIPGGQYKIEVFTTQGKNLPPAERSFTIKKFNPPRFKKTLDFMQKGYSEGDKVQARLKVERTEGGFPDPEATQLEAVARLDGVEFFRSSKIKLNAVGKCYVEFELPKKIEKGIGSLNVIVTEGITENVSKTLPVILKVLDCHLYPEGGSLHYNVKNGVYAESFTPTFDPADFEADLIETKGNEVKILSKVHTLHEGRAYFDVIPRKGCEYALKVTKPSGVTHPIKLPQAVESGCNLFLHNKEKIQHGQDLSIQISDSAEVENQEVYIGLYKRERKIDYKKIIFSGVTDATLSPKDNDGILRLTLFNSKKLPVQERIFFVPPKETLEFQIETNKQVYAPGDKVVLKITPSHPDSVVCVTVSDDAVYKMKEKRKRMARLPVLQFLEHEVKELYDSDSYFIEDEDDEKNIPPAVKMDLLCGTQGWRNFIYNDPETWFNNHEDQKKAKKFLNIEYDPNIDVIKQKQEEFKIKFKNMVECEPMEGMMIEENEILEEKDGIQEKEEVEELLPPMEILEEVKKEEEPEQPMPEIPEEEPMPEEQKKEEEEEEEEEEDEDEEEEEEEEKALDMDFMMGMEMGECMEDIALSMDDDEEIFDGLEVISLPYRRVFSHTNRPGRKIGDREDFIETLYYEPYRVLKKKSFDVEFFLNDAVSTFCVFIDGFTKDGVMGFSNDFIIQSLAPYYLEPKMPLELTFGDHFYLPSIIVNNTDMKLTSQMKVRCDELEIPKDNLIHQLKPYERIGEYIEMIVPTIEKEEITINLSGSIKDQNTLKDSVSRKCKVSSFGFPQTFDQSGRLDSSGPADFSFTMPSEIIKNSLNTDIKVYPSAMASLMEGVESLIRQPGGCFEQTSMTMYPMIMALMYLKMSNTINEELQSKANKFIESGYLKLTGYECKKHGYEWFGSDPGHEALTAMGVLEFSDLNKIFPVDQGMMKRTVNWLISRLNEKKDGFKRNPRALDYFGGAPESTTDAYIAFALSRSKVIPFKDLELLVNKLEKESYEKDRNDSYFISLTALTLYNFGFLERSEKLVDHLIKEGYQIASGKIDRSKSSITSSSGDDLSIQTTSLAILNLLNFKKKYMDEAEMGINYLGTKNSGGRFGSTQSTVLALEAMIAYTIASAETEAGGSLELEINGKVVETIDFEKGCDDSFVFKDQLVRDAIVTGVENKVSLKMNDGCKMPYSFQINYFTAKPAKGHVEEVLTFNAILKNKKLKEGELSEIDILLQNNESEKHHGMTVVIINLPSGLVPRFEKLEELKKTGIIDFFELMGARKLVLYWRQLKAKERKSFMIEVTADIPGKWKAMASFAYIYYNDVNKYYIDGLEVEIDRKK